MAFDYVREEAKSPIVNVYLILISEIKCVRYEASTSLYDNPTFSYVYDVLLFLV